eukprot:5123806-Pleurochrysis_carterae.AAC.4
MGAMRAGIARRVANGSDVLSSHHGAPSLRRFMSSKIIYTKTDEAPALATYALLPIVQRFTAWASIAIETADISVASRVLSAFPERMKAAEHKVDTLAQLGDLAKTPEANIIKLPNVSASTTQLVSAIKELQGKGFDLPDFPATPSTPEEQEIYA